MEGLNEGLEEGSIKDSGLEGPYELMKNNRNCAAMNENKTEKVFLHITIS